jgi:hypothetical protein
MPLTKSGAIKRTPPIPYTESRFVKLMSSIAAETGCEFFPFSQVLLLDSVNATLGGKFGEGAGGICYGLCVAWLETLEKGEDFLQNIKDSENPLLYRAYVAHRHQSNYADDQYEGTDIKTSLPIFKEVQSGIHSTGLNQFGRNDAKKVAKAKEKFFGATAITQNRVLMDAVKTRKYGKARAEMLSLFAWMGASNSRRYFMISSDGHQMAAVGSRFGAYSFFDPNCGIVTSSNKDKIALCLARYFENPIVSVPYKAKAINWLTVEKYKKYDDKKIQERLNSMRAVKATEAAK